ncbi:MAG: hypothetical protein PVH93_04805 [Nitrosopumilaceae archaeon]
MISISIVGIIGIPMGDPQFLVNAILLESSFIALAAVSVWRLQYSVIPNMIIAVIVVIGNTVSPKHIEIMMSFVPAENAIVLIVGGYVLQGLLLVASAIAFQKRKQLAAQIK